MATATAIDINDLDIKDICVCGQDIDIDHISDIYWDGKYDGVSYWDALEMFIYLMDGTEIAVHSFDLDPDAEKALAAWVGV